jgi:hypothetical protein
VGRWFLRKQINNKSWVPGEDLENYLAAAVFGQVQLFCPVRGCGNIVHLFSLF